MKAEWPAVVALLAAGLALGTWQDQARAAGGTDPATRAVRLLLDGPSARARAAATSLAAALGSWQEAARQKEELAELRRMKAAMEGYAERVAFLEAELVRSRAAAASPTFGMTPVRAAIVGFDPHGQRLALSAGKAEGIEPGMPVTTSAGLLAIVESASDSGSQAMLLTSASCTFGGITASPKPVAGLVKGYTPGRLLIELLEEGEVVPGVEVVTSGYSAAIPRGLKVGTVLEVRQDPGIGIRQATILPSARVGEAIWVTVLK